MSSQRQTLEAWVNGFFLAIALALLFFTTETICVAGENLSPAQIIFVNDYVISLRLATAYQFKPGEIGLIWRDGVRMAVVRITKVHSTTLDTEIFTGAEEGTLKTGESVFFEVRLTAKGRRKEDSPPKVEPNNFSNPISPIESKPSSTLKSEIGSEPEEPFVPLLAPPPTQKKIVVSRPSNISHGRVRLRNIYQTVNTSNVHYLTSRLDTDGSIDRINAGPWSLLWSGNVSYRDGNSYSSSSDFRQAEPHLYQSMLSRKGAAGGFMRIGRVLPYELSGLGYVDGIQMETHVNDHVRIGLAGGARPDRRDLSFSGKEVLAAGYATLEAGKLRHLYYSGTLGVLETMYKGIGDELALLYDQRVDLGPKLNFYSSSQIDFNNGAARVRNGPRLTRIDFYGNAPVAKFLGFRAGFSHYERPDINAERDLSGQDNLSSFDKGTWRYWASSTQYLIWKLQLDEEVAVLRTPDNADQTLWRGGVTRRGFFFIPNAQITVSGYNLNKSEGEGYGGLLAALLPFLDNRLNINLLGGFRYSGKVGEPKKFRTNDFSVQGNWRITRAWELGFGFTRSFQDYIQTTIIDGSLAYRW